MVPWYVVGSFPFWEMSAAEDVFLGGLGGLGVSPLDHGLAFLILSVQVSGRAGA